MSMQESKHYWILFRNSSYPMEVVLTHNQYVTICNSIAGQPAPALDQNDKSSEFVINNDEIVMITDFPQSKR